jgi:hypothetical protein
MLSRGLEFMKVPIVHLGRILAAPPKHVHLNLGKPALPKVGIRVNPNIRKVKMPSRLV